MIVPRYYENLSVLHENTMPARAYYIPASRRMDNLVEHREESDRMQLLNGTWKFQYFNSIYDIQESFFEKDYDTENFDENGNETYYRLDSRGQSVESTEEEYLQAWDAYGKDAQPIEFTTP